MTVDKKLCSYQNNLPNYCMYYWCWLPLVIN